MFIASRDLDRQVAFVLGVVQLFEEDFSELVVGAIGDGGVVIFEQRYFETFTFAHFVI